MVTHIIADNMGDVRKSKNVRVAANQTIVRGDPVTLAGGVASKGAIGTAVIAGFAAHDITTGATPNNETDRLIIEVASGGKKFKGRLANAVATPTGVALENTDVGLIVEGGVFRIDPAALTKQFTVVRVVEPFDQRAVQFVVKAANRAE